jgi:tRNA (guanine37-N1)-methyltransferase
VNLDMLRKRGLKAAHDVIGSIAILEIDRSLRKYRFALARAVMAQNAHIKTVLMKQGGHEGRLRTQRMGFVMGKRTKETEHRESGVRLMLDVEKVYFSPRLAGERLRVARQVKDGERVLVMFSGCGPYCFVIAKHARPKEVIGVELNANGHRYALKNKALNKAADVSLLRGDVRRIVPSLGAFDRIAMPLPKGGEDFLDLAFTTARKGCIIHFYDFLHETEIPGGAEEKIVAAAKRNKKKATILGTVRCGQQKPYTFRTCTDFILG